MPILEVHLLDWRVDGRLLPDPGQQPGIRPRHSGGNETRKLWEKRKTVLQIANALRVIKCQMWR